MSEYTERQLSHPLFPLYEKHVDRCRGMLIESDPFDAWLATYEDSVAATSPTQDPQYPAFLRWMAANEGGKRPCPGGQFPHNFYYWQEGGRW